MWVSMPGDANLAMFRVLKVEDEKDADTAEETEGELDNDDKSDTTETSWTSTDLFCVVKNVQLCFIMPLWYKHILCLY